MYWISKLDEGRYLCECRIQDGTKRWEHDSLRTAIDSMIESSWVMSHESITQQDIQFCDRCRAELDHQITQPIGYAVDYLDLLEEAYEDLPVYMKSGQVYPSQNSVDSFHTLARIYMPDLIKTIREQAMLLHDLQEESRAAREVMRLREALEEILGYSPIRPPQHGECDTAIDVVVEIARKALEKDNG